MWIFSKVHRTFGASSLPIVFCSKLCFLLRTPETCNWLFSKCDISFSNFLPHVTDLLIMVETCVNENMLVVCSFVMRWASMSDHMEQFNLNYKTNVCR